MSWTKRQFIDEAFREIGLASYVFDLTPSELESALKRMDAMMAQWNAKGIRVGYPISSTPSEGELSTETNVPDSATQAIILGLAVQIAPGYGKIISPDTKAGAMRAYDTLLAKAAMPNEKQYPGELPVGEGNKRYGSDGRDVFFPEPIDPLQAGNDATLDY